jgi:hypothetical protein
MMDRMADSEIADVRWQGLYQLGGVAALVIAVLLVAEVVVYAFFPRAGTAAEEFAMFQSSWLVGLLTLDLLGMIAYLLFVPTILALYVALHRASEAVTGVGSVLFFIGIAEFFAANTAFSVLSLSSEYAAAETEAEKAMLLAAGQAMLTMFNENAFLVSYVIVSAGWAMISAVMLRNDIFSRTTAYAGIAAGAAGIAAVILEHLPVEGAVGVAIALYFAAIVFLLAWVLLVGIRLCRLPVHAR